jgi:hypothetical protein
VTRQASSGRTGGEDAWASAPPAVAGGADPWATPGVPADETPF